MATSRVVSASRVIHAPAAEIFNLLADPARHADLDASGSVLGPREAPARLSLGATFSMNMKIGRSYFTKNRVVAFTEGREIAWCHWAKFVWRYVLEPVEDGTLVTESFDYNRPWGRVIERWGWPAQNQVNMVKTLDHLEALLRKG